MYTRITRFTAWLGCALLLACASPLHAADAQRMNELERKLEQSLKRIEELTTRVQQLEAQQSPVPANAAAPAAASSNGAAPSAEPAETTSAAATPATPAPLPSAPLFGPDGTLLRGFADVGVGFNDGDPNKGFNVNEGFAIGSLDFFFTPQFGPRAKALIELLFEFGEDGDLAVDLERAQMGYVFADWLTTWIGRYHTPYGYWNTGFHHGQQLQTSLQRPRFIEFEDAGGVVPAHSVGLWFNGALPMGSGKFHYDVGLANSPRIDLEGADGSGVLNMVNVGSPQQKYMLSGNLAYSFPNGLKLGGHWLRARVRDDATNALTGEHNVTRLNMLGAYAFFDNDEWEGFAEYYHFNNRDLSSGSGSHKSWAGFVQLGRRFERFTPYGRLEKGDYDQNDFYFAQQASGRSYRRTALGLRYDLDPKAALKFELTNTKESVPDDDINEARFQYSIRF